MTKVLVLYYSTYGHIEKMAGAVAEGAREAGAEVTIKRVPELVPIRYGRTLASPFTFLRGSPIVMANDLARSPVSGRNFEYLSEDPYLNARLAVPYIQGVQSQGVSATVSSATPERYPGPASAGSVGGNGAPAARSGPTRWNRNRRRVSRCCSTCRARRRAASRSRAWSSIASPTQRRISAGERRRAAAVRSV